MNIDIFSRVLRTWGVTRLLFVNRIPLQRIRADQPHAGNALEIINIGSQDAITLHQRRRRNLQVMHIQITTPLLP